MDRLDRLINDLVNIYDELWSDFQNHKRRKDNPVVRNYRDTEFIRFFFVINHEICKKLEPTCFPRILKNTSFVDNIHVFVQTDNVHIHYNRQMTKQWILSAFDNLFVHPANGSFWLTWNHVTEHPWWCRLQWWKRNRPTPYYFVVGISHVRPYLLFEYMMKYSFRHKFVVGKGNAQKIKHMDQIPKPFCRMRDYRHWYVDKSVWDEILELFPCLCIHESSDVRNDIQRELENYVIRDLALLCTAYLCL